MKSKKNASKSVFRVSREVFLANDTHATKNKRQMAFRADNKQTATLILSGQTAAENAINRSKALGLDITFMEDGVIYREKPDGSREIISVTIPSYTQL